MLSSTKKVFTTKPLSPIVTPKWVKENLSTIKLLDASWYLPTMKRNAYEEYCTQRLPGAKFFDIDGVSDTSSDLPHMLPSSDHFSKEMDRLGITNDDTVIVYDTAGVFSAPRVWWTFRVFGHSDVAVMNGGLPKWRHLKYPLETSELKQGQEGEKANSAPSSYQVTYNAGLVRSIGQMIDNNSVVTASCPPTIPVIDARPAGRFEGTAPEPRPSIPSGHMPGSTNIPFVDVCDNHEGGWREFKGVTAMQGVFAKAGIDASQPVIATCGSGVTASVLALALEAIKVEAGLSSDPSITLYDGSWSEYASCHLNDPTKYPVVSKEE